MQILFHLLCAFLLSVSLEVKGENTHSSSRKTTLIKNKADDQLAVPHTRNATTLNKTQERDGYFTDRREDRPLPTINTYVQVPYPTGDYDDRDYGAATRRPTRNQANQAITPDPETVAYIADAIRAYQPGSPGSPFVGIPFNNPFLPPSSTVSPRETRINGTVVSRHQFPHQNEGFPGFEFARNNGNIPYYVVPFLPSNSRSPDSNRGGLPNLPERQLQPNPHAQRERPYNDQSQSPSSSERRPPPVNHPPGVPNNSGYYIFPPPPPSRGNYSPNLRNASRDYNYPDDYPQYDYDYRQNVPPSGQRNNGEEVETRPNQYSPVPEHHQNIIREQHYPVQNHHSQQHTTPGNFPEVTDHRNTDLGQFINEHGRPIHPHLNYGRDYRNRPEEDRGYVAARNHVRNHDVPTHTQRDFYNTHNLRPTVRPAVYNVPVRHDAHLSNGQERETQVQTNPRLNRNRQQNLAPQSSAEDRRRAKKAPVERNRNQGSNTEYIPLTADVTESTRTRNYRPDFYRDGTFEGNDFREFGNEDNGGRNRPLPNYEDLEKDFENRQIDIEKHFGGEEVFPDRNSSRSARIRLLPGYSRNDRDDRDRSSSWGRRLPSSVPSCAAGNNVTFCLEDVNYPRENITKSVEESESVMEHLLRGNSVITDPRLTDASRPEQGNAVYTCPSTVHYARPLRAMSSQGEWKTIVNLSGTHGNSSKPEQIVRMELCLSPKASCSYSNSNLSSTCQQRKIRHRLLAWSEEKGLHVDFFELPVACACGAN